MFQATELFLQVIDGLIVDPPQKVYIGGSDVTRKTFPKPTRVGRSLIGILADDPELALFGIYRLWTDEETRPGEDFRLVEGPIVVDSVDKRCLRLDTWEKMVPADWDNVLLKEKTRVIEILEIERDRRVNEVRSEFSDWLEIISNLHRILQKMLDGTIVARDKSDFQTLRLPLEKVNEVLNAMRLIRADIEAATTLEQLKTIVANLSEDPRWP